MRAVVVQFPVRLPFFIGKVSLSYKHRVGIEPTERAHEATVDTIKLHIRFACALMLVIFIILVKLESKNIHH